jgi:WD40 repeat protein
VVLGLAARLPTLVQQRWRCQLPEAVTALHWRPGASGGDGDVLAAGADGWIRSYRADIGGERLAWQAHDGGITRLCLRPRPSDAGSDKSSDPWPAALASAGEDGRIRLWGAGGEHVTTLAEESNWVEHLAWSPDGRFLAASAGRSIHLWRGEESLGIWYDAARSVLALAWAPDSRRLATAANKGLYLWEVGGQAPAQLMAFPGAPVVLGWRPDGKALAVGTQDGFLQVWRQAGAGSGHARRMAGSSQLTMRGYPAKVTCLDWHPTRSRVATAGGQDVVLWEIPTVGEGEPTPLRLHRTAVTALTYSPDGNLLASGDRDGRVCFWRDGDTLLQSVSLDAEISAAAWNGLETAIAFGCTNGTITVLDIDAAARTTDARAGRRPRP